MWFQSLTKMLLFCSWVLLSLPLSATHGLGVGVSSPFSSDSWLFREGFLGKNKYL